MLLLLKAAVWRYCSSCRAGWTTEGNGSRASIARRSPFSRVSRVLQSPSMELGDNVEPSSPGFSGGAGGKGMTGIVNLHPHGGHPAVDLTDRVHLLPCSIKHDGPCPVSHYFKPKRTDVVVDDLCIEEAFFRGRKLQGVAVPIPEGYRGYVLGKMKSNGGKNSGPLEEGVSQWVSRAEFGNLTYWNHDSFPSPDDPLLRCFHWFSVSDALHKPVTQEDMDSAMPQSRND